MFKMRNLLILIGLLVLALPALAQSSTPEATPGATPAATEQVYTIGLGANDAYFVGPNGLTLYTYTVDAINKSNCTGQCLNYWPPLTVAAGTTVTADYDIHGTVGTITRDDGSTQVTYNGWPLYYFKKDKAAGDTFGEGVTNNWWMVTPSTVAISQNDALGQFLVGEKGMTVYMFKKDTAGATTSACTGDCAKAWPAVTVADASKIIAGDQLHGTLGSIKRDDGTVQVTYNGWPLYYFAKDAAIGDTMGQGVGGVWNVVAPETVWVSKDATLGDILVGNMGGKTLYTFSKDTSGTSTCTGDCAKAWPPFTVSANQTLVLPQGATGTLALIKGTGSTEQVTYNGAPLYYFAKDAKPGDTMGQGVGGVWNVAKP